MIFKRMPRNVKKKLALFAGTSKCLVYAEAKYCASEMPGEIKYYECSRTEYCCAFGCCVSPGLHFHHLWYYWILVIIMFLVCSGGGWWYRYWLQGRYRAAASAIPSRSSSSRTQSTSLRGPTCQAQQARITYNTARNTVLLHRMWKGPQRNGAAPMYNGNATTSTQYQNMNVILNDSNCPYYQLYGPPPSYETVIAQSRGKLSNPASPEAARLNVQQTLQASMSPTTNVIPNPSVPQCFAYPCSPSRLAGSADGSPACQNAASSRQDNAPFVRFTQYCAPGGTIRQNFCIPYEYQEREYHGGAGGYLPYAMDKSSDTSDAEIPTSPRYAITSGERATSGASSSREPGQSSWQVGMDGCLSKVHKPCGRLLDKNRVPKDTETHGSDTATSDSRSEDSVELSKDFEQDSSTQKLLCAGYSTNVSESLPDDRQETTGGNVRDRRICGGSLKLPGRYNARAQNSADRRKSSYKDSGGPREEVFDSARRANVGASPSQSSPSNNVILASCVLGTENGGSCTPANSNFESKHRLDRSRSLD